MPQQCWKIWRIVVTITKYDSKEFHTVSGILWANTRAQAQSCKSTVYQHQSWKIAQPVYSWMDDDFYGPNYRSYYICLFSIHLDRLLFRILSCLSVLLGYLYLSQLLSLCDVGKKFRRFQIYGNFILGIMRFRNSSFNAACLGIFLSVF